MKRTSQALLLVPLALLAVSCANFSVKRLKPGQATLDTHGAVTRSGPEEGVRFYRPWPYVLIRKEGKDGSMPSFSAQVLMLPDPEQEYVITWKPGFGSVKPSFQLTDGWNLTGVSSEVTAGTAPMLGSLASLITAAAADFVVKDEADLKPGLYKMVWDSGTKMWKVQKDRIAIPFPLVEPKP